MGKIDLNFSSKSNLTDFEFYINYWVSNMTFYIEDIRLMKEVLSRRIKANQIAETENTLLTSGLTVLDKSTDHLIHEINDLKKKTLISFKMGESSVGTGLINQLRRTEQLISKFLNQYYKLRAKLSLQC